MPPWLATVAVGTGLAFIFIGVSLRYLRIHTADYGNYSHQRSIVIATTVALAISGATYVSVVRHDLTLLFTLMIYLSGRLIQGALAARIVQRVLQAVEGSRQEPITASLYQYIYTTIRDRLIFFSASCVIITATGMSIILALTSESIGTDAAIRSFWIGFFFLVVVGLMFDFRHFEHRMPRPVALGMVLAISGALLYDPVNFSSITAFASPYLSTPIPDWARAPIGWFGFFAGLGIWALYYTREH